MLHYSLSAASATPPDTRGFERAKPDRVTLPMRDGVVRSDRPPVEIYLGSEPVHYRAARSFLWSIEQVRDAGRVYHVHVMSELAGFERRGWATGFSNYRFAIPHFAGGRGRAIYCDVDQILLSDPARLFDLPFHGVGYLARSDVETSVMLIDCERMAGVWSIRDARHERENAILRRTRRHPGIRGDLDPDWNAREEEYVPGRSQLLHYSTMHTQPWRPFPDRFVYRHNRHEKLWWDLDRGALEVGFEVFSAENPTSLFRDLAANPPPSGVTDCQEPVREATALLIADLEVGSLLEVTGLAPACNGHAGASWRVKRSRSTDLLSLLAAGSPRSVEVEAEAGVLVLAGLEEIAPEDLPWVVETIFKRARRFVVAQVTRSSAKAARRGPPRGAVGQREWWVAHFEAASRRHPELHWQLALCADDGVEFCLGGRFPRKGPPRVWVLSDDRPGNATQSLGLAEVLGWPFETIELEFWPTIYLPNPLLGASGHVLRSSSRRQLRAPWPDLVISSGRRPAPVARWIAKRSHGRTRIVQLGRKGANPAKPFDLAVSPDHAGLCPHPNRMETAGPLTRITPARLEQAARQWRHLFDPFPRPHIAVLVGGSSHHFLLTPQIGDRLARDVAGLAKRSGGSIFVTTSRRTGDAVTQKIVDASPDAAHFHRWQPDQAACENPILGYFALADLLVVTGESESMIAEGIAAGKRVHIYPLPRRRLPLPLRAGSALIDFIVACAEARPRGARGTTRPQQGLELFCSRLIQKGYVRPQRDLLGVHQSLVTQEMARIFDGLVGEKPCGCHNQVDDVADRVRELMGMTGRSPRS